MPDLNPERELLTSEFVTVAEAARALGIDPKQVRRYAERLRTQDRTPAGHVPLRVRLSALETVRAEAGKTGHSHRAQGQKKPAEASAEEAGHKAGQDTGHRQDIGQDRTQNNGDMSFLPAPVYQRRIEDLEARLSDQKNFLQARIESLEADKSRLFAALEQAQQNLSREQMLRALPPPAKNEYQAEPVTAPERGSGGATGEVSEEANLAQGRADANASGEEAQSREEGILSGGTGRDEAAETKVVGWWDRLWKRTKN